MTLPQKSAAYELRGRERQVHLRTNPGLKILNDDPMIMVLDFMRAALSEEEEEPYLRATPPPPDPYLRATGVVAVTQLSKLQRKPGGQHVLPLEQQTPDE